MSDQMEYILFDNKFNNDYGIDRKHFGCLQVSIPTNGDWYNRVKRYAMEIEARLNPGQANSSEKRDEKTIEIDNLSGVIAEHACSTVLQSYLGKKNIIKPLSTSSKNQIDIELANGKRTIEVRSSCVVNGIDFAIFAKDKSSKKGQYFDVIGPYTNEYKSVETLKDYYMRVLYWCKKSNYMELTKQPELKLYITGGATKKMMCDTNLYQIKHLVPADGDVEVESDYRVIPLGKSLDFAEFINAIKEENNL